MRLLRVLFGSPIFQGRMQIVSFAHLTLADCPAVSLDLCIYTNKYPNVKQLSWAINYSSTHFTPKIFSVSGPFGRVERARPKREAAPRRPWDPEQDCSRGVQPGNIPGVYRRQIKKNETFKTRSHSRMTSPCWDSTSLWSTRRTLFRWVEVSRLPSLLIDPSESI